MVDATATATMASTRCIHQASSRNVGLTFLSINHTPSPLPSLRTLTMAYYESDAFRRSHVSPDVMVEDEDGKQVTDSPDHPEVFRVKSNREPAEPELIYRKSNSSSKRRGLGSFMCGCMGISPGGVYESTGGVYESTESLSASLSAKTNSIKTASPTESSAASDGTPFDNSVSSYPNSEQDMFDSNVVVGPELTAARLQPLQSTGFDEGCAPVVQEQQYVAMYQPTLMSHRSLQVHGAICRVKLWFLCFNCASRRKTTPSIQIHASSRPMPNGTPPLCSALPPFPTLPAPTCMPAPPLRSTPPPWTPSTATFPKCTYETPWIAPGPLAFHHNPCSDT